MTRPLTATGALSTLSIGGEAGPRGRAKLLLSREPGDASTRSSGSAGASPSRGRRTIKLRLDRALVDVGWDKTLWSAGPPDIDVVWRAMVGLRPKRLVPPYD